MTGEISRRDFLKLSVIGTGSFALLTDFLDPFEKTDNRFKEVSYSYITRDPLAAEEVAKKIRMDKGASAFNICGPLATSILLGWKLHEDGTISNTSGNDDNMVRMQGVTPADMWLGSPENDPNRYKVIFPPEEYDSFHIRESIGTLNFNHIPGVGTLLPGDFLYLDGGSFTHYLAISRRDAKGKLYCVSNLFGIKPGEFFIDEVLLWDPLEKKGFFRDWAKGIGAERARTGLKGFYLWRRKAESEYLVEGPQARKFRDLFTNEMRGYKRGNWNINIYEAGKGQIFEWRNAVPYYNEPGTRLPLAIVALKIVGSTYSDEIKQEGLAIFLKRRGFEGTSFEQLLNSTLNDPYGNAAQVIVRFCKEKANLRKEFDILGLYSTTFETKRTTQKDMFRCWKSLFIGNDVDRDATSYLLGKFENAAPKREGVINEIKKFIPGIRIWSIKTNPGQNVASIQDSGVIAIPQREKERYLFVNIRGISRHRGELTDSDIRRFSSTFTSIIMNYIHETGEKSNGIFPIFDYDGEDDAQLSLPFR
ncbi:MAG TPA: hypothetical protein VLH85_02720 [Levilinea sp.]|nr:hypothetical protein [Levilinea sp.]